MSNLRITSGDAYSGARRLVVTVTDPAGATVDLTGTTGTFVAKRRRTDTTAAIEKAVTLAEPQSGATKGIAYIELDEADTASLAGTYRWELEAEDSIGTITLASGNLYVTQDLITGS